MAVSINGGCDTPRERNFRLFDLKKIKIIHIITKLEFGGAQLNTLFTVENINKDFFEVSLITSDKGYLVGYAKKIHGVKLYFIPEMVRDISPLKDLFALLKIRRILRRIKKEGGPLIVHTHSSKAGILGRWAANSCGIKVIIHSIHGFGFEGYRNFFKRKFLILLEKITSKVTTWHISVSRDNIFKGKSLGILKPDKVSLIRSGIDLKMYKTLNNDKEKIKSKLCITEKDSVVTMIACLKPQKNPLDFVMVAKEVLSSVPETKFLLIGDGLLRKEVESLIRFKGINKNFFLLGWREDVPEILGISNILVLTSIWEGLPRVIPEAMASGIPVVANGVDGVNDVIKDGYNGFLIKPGDIKSMAEKIIYLLKNTRVLKIMGERGRDVVGEFNIWDMVKKQESLYMNLTGITL